MPPPSDDGARRPMHLVVVDNARMRIELDVAHGLAYVLLRPELKGTFGFVARSVRACEHIVLDLDAAGVIVGIEVLTGGHQLARELARTAPGLSFEAF